MQEGHETFAFDIGRSASHKSCTHKVKNVQGNRLNFIVILYIKLLHIKIDRCFVLIEIKFPKSHYRIFTKLKSPNYVLLSQ